MVPDDFRLSATCDTTYLGVDTPYRVAIRCDSDTSCSLSSQNTLIGAANTGLPTGTPLGELHVSKNMGDCPATGGEVVLNWAPSGRVPDAFVVMRGTDPSSIPVLTPADGTVYADGTADCQPAEERWVYFYTILDRNTCTGESIP
jgi:hypothetical protein